MFWFNNPEILLDKDKLMDFFPMIKQTYEERLNSITRLALYISIILSFYHKDLRWLLLFIFTSIFTIILYRGRVNADKEENKSNKQDNIENEKETFDDENIGEDKNSKGQEKCTMPTLDNPFMNATMKDYLNVDPTTNKIVDRPPACDTSDPNVKREMDKLFDNNLFKDIDDIFGKMNSQRQFYTMPSTTIPNDQDKFAKWLYLSPKTCKEDQDYCLRYEDIRAKRPVYLEPEKNPINTNKIPV